MVFSCLGPPRPGGAREKRYGRLLGKVLYRSGGDHLQIGEYRLGVYMGQGRLIAIVLVVFVMLAVLVVLVVATMVLVVLARSAIASVVLVVLAWTAIALVVLARTAMMLVEARAMVAVASVVARAMVVARSAGGISYIYGGRRRGLASRWGGRSSMCCSICAIVRARGSGVSRGCGAPIRRSRCRDSY